MEKITKKQVIVATSGGFDPLHVGHIRLMQEAKKLGDKLIVIVNGDDWLKRKKGFVFMPLEERMELIRALSSVDQVIAWDDGTEHINGALQMIRPHIFAKGGDRDSLDKIPEARTCKEIGCDIVFGVGGGKAQSSSDLVKKIKTDHI